MPSRDQLTRQMAGDPFGSVSERSRFATGSTGDPFLPIAMIAGSLAKKGLAALGRKLAKKGMSPDVAMMHTPRSSVGFPSLPQRGSVTARARVLPSLPAGSRRQVFPAGVGATRAHRRTMRVTNVKALRRAMRRVQGFAKLAHRTISFTKRVHMKRGRRGRR
jgi:hypothetical protein